MMFCSETCGAENPSPTASSTVGGIQETTVTSNTAVDEHEQIDEAEMDGMHVESASASASSSVDRELSSELQREKSGKEMVIEQNEGEINTSSSIAENHGLPLIKVFVPAQPSVLWTKPNVIISEKERGTQIVYSTIPESIPYMKVAGGNENIIDAILQNQTDHFTNLTHFDIVLDTIWPRSGSNGDLIDFRNFFRSHNSIECVSIEQDNDKDSRVVRSICRRVCESLHCLQRLTGLRLHMPRISIGLSNLADCSHLLYLSLQCIRLMSNVKLSAPNLRYCTIIESDRGGEVVVDLSDMHKLVKLEFSPADESRKIIVPLSNSHLSWLSLACCTSVHGDLSSVVILELLQCDGPASSQLMGRCKTLREVSLWSMHNIAIDARGAIRVVSLHCVNDVVLHTLESRPIDILSCGDNVALAKNDTIHAKRVWLSVTNTPCIKLSGTISLGAFCKYPQWDSDAQIVLDSIRKSLIVLSLSPMLPLPSLPSLKYLCVPTLPDLPNRLPEVCVLSNGFGRSERSVKEFWLSKAPFVSNTVR